MSSGKVIDLRGRSAVRRPPTGQQPLFPPRVPKEKRPMPLRARRRRVRAIKALIVLLLLLGAAWGVSYVSYLPQFSVQSINVVGAQAVPRDLIENYAWTVINDGSHHFISRGNIFIYPRAVVENAIVGYFPRIKSASVSRSTYLSTALTIRIEERQPFALWCTSTSRGAGTTENSCYQMDDRGFIFAEVSGAGSVRAGTQYIFEGGLPESSGAASTTAATTPETQSFNPIGKSFVPAHLPGLVTLLRLLGQAGFTPEGAGIESEQDFSVPLAEGFTLKASFGADASTLARNLQLVLSSDALQGKEDLLEYADLRFGDRVYYKLKGEGEVQAP